MPGCHISSWHGPWWHRSFRHRAGQQNRRGWRTACALWRCSHLWTVSNKSFGLAAGRISGTSPQHSHHVDFYSKEHWHECHLLGQQPSFEKEVSPSCPTSDLRIRSTLGRSPCCTPCKTLARLWHLNSAPIVSCRRFHGGWTTTTGWSPIAWTRSYPRTGDSVSSHHRYWQSPKSTFSCLRFVWSQYQN